MDNLKFSNDIDKEVLLNVKKLLAGIPENNIFENPNGTICADFLTSLCERSTIIDVGKTTFVLLHNKQTFQYLITDEEGLEKITHIKKHIIKDESSI
jgi:hypothetical protein